MRPQKSLLVFIALSAVASALNYMAYPLLSRVLPENQYISITVALSLFTQMATFLASITAIAIGLSKSEHDKTQVNAEVRLLQQIVFRLFALLSVVFLVIAPFVLPKIQIPVVYCIPIIFMMLASIPISVASGALNAAKNLVGLGILTSLSALLQLTLAISTAVITQNGLYTMLAMACAQLITLPLIYRLYRELRDVSGGIFAKLEQKTSNKVRQLAQYTVFSSLAIMTINILQVADLLIANRVLPSDAKFYTDIYVISRAVFYIGMVFVTPFLADIVMTKRHQNWQPFLKFSAVVVIVFGAAACGFYLLGDFITRLMFGVTYESQNATTIAVLSIAYKSTFLLITAMALYFTVLRRYAVVWLSLFALTLIGIINVIASTFSDLQQLLLALNLAAICIAIFGLFYMRQVSKD